MRIKIIGLVVCLFCNSGTLWAQSDADKGKELYLSYGCALCHGLDGRGDGPNGQKFNPPPTDFYDPKTYHHGTDTDSLRRSIQYGIKEDASIMPAFEHIPPDELKQIIDYVQSLSKKGEV